MKKNNILISVIIPCYNHGQYIDDAISSVEQYKGNDYEIIIVNDGSTDEHTNMHLSELKDRGYNVIFQENQGLGKTRNNGIKIAKGEYILPLDADNRISPDYISKSIKIFELYPDVSIVYSDRQCFGNINSIYKAGEFSKERIVDGNYIDACAVYRKSLWELVGGYDEGMPLQGWEDWDFWLMAIEKNANFYYIAEPLFDYRVVDNSMIHILNNSDTTNLFKYLYKKHSLLLVEELNNKVSKLENQLNNIRASKAYRLGKVLLNPFTYLKNNYK